MGHLDVTRERKVAGTTSAGNFKHPTYPDSMNWVVQAWEDFDKAGIVKKAQKLGMTAEIGPEIEGYVDEHFQDLQPSGEEVEVVDAEFEESD